MTSYYFDRGTMRQYRQHVAIQDFASDGEMLSDAINGSKALLEALATGHGPDRFPWRERKGAANWTPDRQSMTSSYMVHRVNLIQEREAHAEGLRVSRDPCGVCGTRTDIGCEHRRCA